MTTMRNLRRAGAPAATVLLGLAATALGNVYPSGLSVSVSAFDPGVGATVTLSYVLNEPADGDGVNPGVKIEVLTDPGGTVVRTVTFASQPAGLQTWVWDGRDDGGVLLPDGAYRFRVTASDNGYAAWTQISVDAPSNSFYFPGGISVNRNPASPNYGRVYVSESIAGQPTVGAPGTVRTAPTQDGIYVLRADTAAIGQFTGGRSWPGTYSPWKSTIGPDDRLYVADLTNDKAIEFSDDLATSTVLADRSNLSDYGSSYQWIASIIVEGTQAAGNRRIYLVDNNYYGTFGPVGRKGLVMYDLGSQASATPGDKGTQYIGPDYWNYYPTDAARGASGHWYMNNYRASANQASPLMKFLDAPVPPAINTPAWAVANTYLCSYGLDVDEARARVAYGAYTGNSGFQGKVYIFHPDTGAFIASFTAGSRITDIAFDAVGNLYTADGLHSSPATALQRVRAFSPPDGPNSSATMLPGTFSIAAGAAYITQPPQDVTVLPCAPATFTITAVGSNLSYQWKRGGVPIPGATDPQYTLPSAQPGDNGALFTCVVSNSLASVESSAAMLSIGPAFPVPLANVTADWNGDAVFTVTPAEGINPADVQWQRTTPPGNEFADIPGATGTTLTLPAVQMADQGTQVRCVYTACPGVVSNAATLSIRVFQVQPTPQTAPGWGGSATFTVTPVPGTSGLQWQRMTPPDPNFVDIPGATDTTLTLTNLQATDSNSSFRVRLTTPEAYSSAVKLTVNPWKVGFSKAVTHNNDPTLASMVPPVSTTDLIAGQLGLELEVGAPNWHEANTRPEDRLPAFTDGTGPLGAVTGLLNDYGNTIPVKIVRYDLGDAKNISSISIYGGNPNAADGRVFITSIIKYSTDNGQTFQTFGYFEDVPSGFWLNYRDWKATLIHVARDEAYANPLAGVTHLEFEFYSSSGVSPTDPNNWVHADPFDGTLNPYTNVNDGFGVVYISPMIWEIDVQGASVCQAPVFDVAGGGPNGDQKDNVIDMLDFAVLQRCLTVTQEGSFEDLPLACRCMDVTGPGGSPDRRLTIDDIAAFVQCATGPGVQVTDPGCTGN